MPIPQDSGEFSQRLTLRVFTPWQGWGELGEETPGKSALQFYCVVAPDGSKARCSLLLGARHRENLKCLPHLGSRIPQRRVAAAKGPGQGSRCRVDRGCLLLRRDYFKMQWLSDGLCRFGEGGGWGLEEKGQEGGCFPGCRDDSTSGPSPVSVFREASSALEEKDHGILCCIPRSPQYPSNPWFTSMWLPESRPLGWQVASLRWRSWAAADPRRDADWGLCGHCRRRGLASPTQSLHPD